MSENNLDSKLDGDLDLGSIPPDCDLFDPFADSDSESETDAEAASIPEDNAGSSEPETEEESRPAAKAVDGLIADLFPGDPFKEDPETKEPETGAAPKNPITATIEKKEDNEAEQAAKSLFEKPPVFSYAGAVEEIEDSSITFDQLRESKAIDFPELEDGKRISWSVVYGKISKRIPTPKKSNRIVPIQEDIFKMLKVHKQLQVLECYPNPLNLVFPSKKGTYTDPRTYQKRIEAVMKRCAILGVNVHALRHTFATRLVEQNIPFVIIKELLGHASIETTMRYTHALQSEKRKAVDVLKDFTPTLNR